MSTFQARQPGLHPTALCGPWGTAFGACFGATKDVVVTYARLAVKGGFVLLAPVDALDHHGADTGIERFPIDDDETFRARIAGAWDLWPWAGTRHVLDVIFGLLNPEGSTRIATARELGRRPWAQWFAFISQATPVGLRSWDTGSTWGTGVWGSLATRNFVRTVRRFARRFSNARDRGTVVILQSSPGVWGTPGTWGTGTWGGKNPRWRV